MWILIPILLVVLLSILSIVNYKKTKNYYTDDNSTIMEESKEINSKLLQLLSDNGINYADSVVVNGHYTKQVKVGVKVTSYYSYLLLLNENNQTIQVINYKLSDQTFADLGVFSINQIKAVDFEQGFNTTYLFNDTNGKKVVEVQTSGHDLPVEDFYQTTYFQEEEYNILRACFNLKTYSHKDQLNGGQK